MPDSIETVRFDRAYPAFAGRSAGCAEAGGRRRRRDSRRRQFGRVHIRGMSRPGMALAPLGTHHIRRGWSGYLTRPSLMGTDVPVGPVRMMHVMRHRFPFDLSPGSPRQCRYAPSAQNRRTSVRVGARAIPHTIPAPRRDADAAGAEHRTQVPRFAAPFLAVPTGSRCLNDGWHGAESGRVRVRYQSGSRVR